VSANLGALVELIRRYPAGMCTESVGGPMSLAPVPLAGASTIASTWQELAYCIGLLGGEPGGTLLDYSVDPPAATALAIGYGFGSGGGPGPHPASNGTASLATLGSDYRRRLARALPRSDASLRNAAVRLDRVARGRRYDDDVDSQQSPTGNRRPLAARGRRRHGQVPRDLGGRPDRRRDRDSGMRVTHADGALDPDGGLLLATTAGGAVGGPVVAFDGGVWLVAWTEVGAGGNDLRAVAVQNDGTVVDATPRLLASGLSDAEPAIASAGDARSLLVYVRPDAARARSARNWCQVCRRRTARCKRVRSSCSC